MHFLLFWGENNFLHSRNILLAFQHLLPRDHPLTYFPVDGKGHFIMIQSGRKPINTTTTSQIVGTGRYARLVHTATHAPRTYHSFAVGSWRGNPSSTIQKHLTFIDCLLVSLLLIELKIFLSLSIFLHRSPCLHFCCPLSRTQLVLLICFRLICALA
jgi:hypothetical protein